MSQPGADPYPGPRLCHRGYKHWPTNGSGCTLHLVDQQVKTYQHPLAVNLLHIAIIAQALVDLEDSKLYMLEP